MLVFMAALQVPTLCLVPTALKQTGALLHQLKGI